MKKKAAWKSNVAALRKFSEESLRQMDEDKERLLRLLKELDEAFEVLQKLNSMQSVSIVKYHSVSPLKDSPMDLLRMKKVVGESRPDLESLLRNQRKRIPTYRSVISRFEQMGTLLKNSLKRISEAEAMLG